MRVQLLTWIVGPVLLLGRGVLTGGLTLLDFKCIVIFSLIITF